MYEINNQDFGTLAVCAVRYALGRSSYMPELVQDIITPRIPTMQTQDLIPILRECRSPWNTVKTMDDWGVFAQLVEAELKARGQYS